MDIKETDIPPNLLPALQIFVRELETHLSFFQDSMNELIDLVQTDTERKTLAHRFHTIKGGAGFFQLKEIRDSADRAEKMLQKSSAETSGEQLSNELVQIVNSLNEHADLLKHTVLDE